MRMMCKKGRIVGNFCNLNCTSKLACAFASPTGEYRKLVTFELSEVEHVL
jgi:hypothetical protein